MAGGGVGRGGLELLLLLLPSFAVAFVLVKYCLIDACCVCVDGSVPFAGPPLLALLLLVNSIIGVRRRGRREKESSRGGL